MLSDFHIHTNFSGDSDTPVEIQIEQALQIGMKEICITDHHDYAMTGGDIDFTLDLPSYLPAVQKAKEAYASKIRVCAGIELGLQIRIKDYLNDYIRAHDFDFIIGSNHAMDGLDLDESKIFEQLPEHTVYHRYFEATLKRVQKLDCFDVLGHLDYAVRYGPDQNRYYSYQGYRDVIDPILKLLIEKGKGLECNTGGFKSGLRHPNPCEDILIRYRELGGEILTVGSDAHLPEYIGYEFDRAANLLKDCGFRYYTVFHDRKPEFIKL